MNKICKRYNPKFQHTLTPKNKEERLAYAHQLLNDGRPGIRGTVFSDEVHFQLNSNRTIYYRLKNKPRVKLKLRGVKAIRFWAGVNTRGKVACAFLDGKFTGNIYRKVIEEQLIPKANDMYGDAQHWQFQQDNHRVHLFRDVMDLFDDKDIILVDHPPNSPDLNPIETIWSHMKLYIHKCKPQAENLIQLRQQIREAWRELKMPLIRKTCYHLLKMAEKVVRVRGEYYHKNIDPLFNQPEQGQ
ncbi:MAG: hypothetical protein GY853_09380 [PVC group bacterium]|nr:hypothetical protein [PVC group bacterium]